MKRCPNCNQIFSDDNSFCLEDGTALILASDSYPSVYPSVNEIPTLVIPRPQVTSEILPQPASSGVSKWLFLIIGILATTVVGMGVFMFAGRGEKEEKKEIANQNLQSENAKENKNQTENTSPKNTPKVNQTVEQPKINPNLNPAGSWSGDWNSSGSYRTYFTAQMNLTDEGGGKFSGEIVWNLENSNNPKKIDKIGASATEYVKGTYNPATRMLVLQGIRVDDPNGIVIKDRYNLVLAENNLTLKGKSKGGNFSLKR